MVFTGMKCVSVYKTTSEYERYYSISTCHVYAWSVYLALTTVIAGRAAPHKRREIPNGRRHPHGKSLPFRFRPWWPQIRRRRRPRRGSHAGRQSAPEPPEGRRDANMAPRERSICKEGSRTEQGRFFNFVTGDTHNVLNILSIDI